MSDEARAVFEKLLAGEATAREYTDAIRRDVAREIAERVDRLGDERLALLIRDEFIGREFGK